MAKGRKVKVVRVSYGILGRVNTREIEKAIEKWMGKGYELEKQDDHPAAFMSSGYTVLTFIEREK